MTGIIFIVKTKAKFFGLRFLVKPVWRRVVTSKNAYPQLGGIAQAGAETAWNDQNHPDRGRMVDIHVGLRLRNRRNELGKTQDALGKALGLSAQQVQKYEAGINRLGASRLYDVARALSVPITFFFEGISPALAWRPAADAAGSAYKANPDQGAMKIAANDPFRGTETLELISNYYRIADPVVRKGIFNLLKSLSPVQNN